MNHVRSYLEVGVLNIVDKLRNVRYGEGPLLRSQSCLLHYHRATVSRHGAGRQSARKQRQCPLRAWPFYPVLVQRQRGSNKAVVTLDPHIGSSRHLSQTSDGTRPRSVGAATVQKWPTWKRPSPGFHQPPGWVPSDRLGDGDGDGGGFGCGYGCRCCIWHIGLLL